MRLWAIRAGFVDKPGHRKIHTRPIALGGGIAIYWTIVLPLLIASLGAVLVCQRCGQADFLPWIIKDHIPGLVARAPQVWVLIGCLTVLHILGIIDDRKHLGPFIKLFVQIAVAAAMALFAGIRFDFFIANTTVTTILSVLWIVVIVNAFNFLDNMDGLSAGMAAICAAVIFVAALMAGQIFVGAFLAIVMGALLGFLVLNFAPARIFMGDGGSLVVGAVVAAAAVRTTYFNTQAEEGSWYAAMMPLVVLAIPLYDFVSVTLLRLSQGKSPFVGDTQHFSHRLVKRGMSTPQAVLTIYLATACTGLGGIILLHASTTGMILIFAQTIMIVSIIAILEQPIK